MRLLSSRRLLGGVALVCAWLALGACTGTPVAVVDDDAGEGGADAAFEASGDDATVEAGPDGRTGNDAATDGTMPMNDSSVDASDGGNAETGTADASDAGSLDASSEAANDAQPEAGGDAAMEAGNDAPSEAESDATDDGESDASAGDAPAEAAPEAAADAPVEAAACTFAGTWSMTVQTVTASPPLCQGVMDCTNCGILFNATATQPTATTIDWNVDPGGVLCTAFSGSITSGGQFTTSETNCNPVGNGSTFDGQIDVPTCSMTATYVYVLPTCTITETMTGTQ